MPPPQQNKTFLQTGKQAPDFLHLSWNLLDVLELKLSSLSFLQNHLGFTLIAKDWQVS